MTWTPVAPPSAGSFGQPVTLSPVADADQGVEFQVQITQRGSFFISSDCQVLISSSTITEP